MAQIDILSVGDTVTDAFIKLQDDQAVAYQNEHGNWLAMPLGAKLPFSHVDVVEAVGNSANASVSFARLGLKSALVTNVGGDVHGRDMVAALDKKGVDTRFVRMNPGKQSNYHYVLWYKAERTILIKHEEYEYRWPRFRKSELPRWVYFSSLGEDALGYTDEIVEWLNDNPDIKLAFQPGTFQIKVGAKRLKDVYKRSEIVVLNREEAVQVTKGNYEDMHDLLDRMHALGPRLVVITDGPAGAYGSDGENRYVMPPYPDPAPPYERTGAGDAFTSTLIAALAKGLTFEEGLAWGPINSMSVVQKVGAQEGLLKERELLQWLHKAPNSYKLKKMR